MGTAQLAALPKADYTLKIEPCSLEIKPGVVVKTTGYNGQVPGPLLRVKEGVPVTIDVTNATAESGHCALAWAGDRLEERWGDGRRVADDCSGGVAALHLYAETRGDALVSHPCGRRRQPDAGHIQRAVWIFDGGGERRPGHYDQEIFLAIHHWKPSFVPMVETMRSESSNAPLTTGSDVGYQYATINQHMLGAGEPIRVKQGQKVLVHLLNASGTENVVLALPGHTFKVMAMDGNPVANPTAVEC